MIKRLYELTVVLNAEATDSELSAIQDLIKQTLLKVKGSVKDVEDWGVKPFSYEIRKQTQGRYFQYMIELAPEMVEDFRGRLRHERSIMRWLLVSAEVEDKKSN